MKDLDPVERYEQARALHQRGDVRTDLHHLSKNTLCRRHSCEHPLSNHRKAGDDGEVLPFPTGYGCTQCPCDLFWEDTWCDGLPVATATAPSGVIYSRCRCGGIKVTKPSEASV